MKSVFRHLSKFFLLICLTGCENPGILSPTTPNAAVLFEEELEIYPDHSYIFKSFEPRDIDNDGIIDTPPIGSVYTPPITLPKILSSVLPSHLYPEITIKAGLQGTVACKFRIYEDGHVGNVQILRGQEIFRQAAIDAVLKINFTPAEQESDKIAVWILFLVNFKLEK